MTSVAIAKKPACGFSLIEVVLSLGVVGFAFVALLGLLPVGLTTFRSAIETSSESQIAQRVSNEIQQARFSDLNTANFTSRFPKYFDDQGMPVSANDPHKVYTVTLGSPTSPTLPGLTNGPESCLFVFKLSIFGKNPANSSSQFSVLVADRGR